MALSFCKNIDIELLWLEHTFYQIQSKQIEDIIGEKLNLIFFSVGIESFI